MDAKIQSIFDNNPEIDKVYKVKGKAIYFTSEAGANDYKKTEKVELETVFRAVDVPVSTGETPPPQDPIVIPEGNPAEAWTIPQIQAWLDEREVKYSKQAKEANLLEKAAEYLKEQKPTE